jgi:hypothetical protein
MYSYTVIKCKYDPNILSRVLAEWITAKKDWKEAKQWHKAAQKLKGDQKTLDLINTRWMNSIVSCIFMEVCLLPFVIGSY